MVALKIKCCNDISASSVVLVASGKNKKRNINNIHTLLFICILVFLVVGLKQVMLT